MRIPNQVVEKLLLSSSDVDENVLEELKNKAEASQTPLSALVVENSLITPKGLTKLYAEYTGIDFVEIDPKTITIEALEKIPEHIARKYLVVLFKIDEDGTNHLAVEDPDDIQAIDFMRKQLGRDIKIHVATKENILGVLDNYRGDIGSEISDVAETQIDTIEETEEANVAEEDLTEDSPTAQTVNLVIEYAIKSGASDIHIEPHESFVQIRNRIDGVLKETNTLPKRLHAALISRIKILSNLKIDERRVPQDGRFKINLKSRVYSFRVSTLPTINGEKVVMRIIDESTEPLPLKILGFWGQGLATITKAINEPHGMILVTGPTGAGKSTTLQSVLNILNEPEVNISTVEDPVEFRIEGVNQTQVNVQAGMTFIGGLRSLLRQDPDVIMVGEIRDGETASLAIQAALTGHLVFSTLHTNNAATALPRLLDMKIEPFLISSTVRAIVGQRLVRRVSKNGCEEYEPSDAEKKSLEETFEIEGPAEWDKILELSNKARSHFDMELADKITFLRPKTGPDAIDPPYKGRMGIYEILDVDVEVQEMIVNNATSDEIQESAIKNDMITMQMDGLIKAMMGLTTIEEILRVTKE